jgi:hypothetical protein
MILVPMTACERDMTLKMNDANPPTFKLSGSGRLIFFAVSEVEPGRISKIDDPTMWEIRPTDENLYQSFQILPTALFLKASGN